MESLSTLEIGEVAGALPLSLFLRHHLGGTDLEGPSSGTRSLGFSFGGDISIDDASGSSSRFSKAKWKSLPSPDIEKSEKKVQAVGTLHSNGK
uniref:Uncharacterized protein n=1 Tax=Cannabis sativa TaxID=3483 RepID=A0A803QBA4_CANSA